MSFNFLFTLRTKFLDAIFISQKSLLVSCQLLFYSEQAPPFTFPRLKVHLLTTWEHCNSNENMIYYMYRSHPANLASLCMKPTRSIKKVTQATQIHIHTEAWVYIPVNIFDQTFIIMSPFCTLYYFYTANLHPNITEQNAAWLCKTNPSKHCH